MSTDSNAKRGDAWDSYWRGHEDGYEAGYANGARAIPPSLVEERARELLLAEADRIDAFARRAAEQRHGPAWAAMLRDAS